MEIEFGKYYPPDTIDTNLLFLKYEPLICKFAHMGKKYGIDEFNDAKQICSYAFWKAYLNFNPDVGDGKGKTLVSYLKTSMANALRDECKKILGKNKTYNGIKVITLSIYDANPVNNYAEVNATDFDGENYTHFISNDKEIYHEKGLDQVENADFCDKLLSRLGEKHRTVVELYYIQSLTQSEIAKIMKITQPAVSTLLKEAEAQCRRIIVRENLLMQTKKEK